MDACYCNEVQFFLVFVKRAYLAKTWAECLVFLPLVTFHHSAHAHCFFRFGRDFELFSVERSKRAAGSIAKTCASFSSMSMLGL